MMKIYTRVHVHSSCVMIQKYQLQNPDGIVTNYQADVGNSGRERGRHERVRESRGTYENKKK